jgi:hypothetical protein
MPTLPDDQWPADDPVLASFAEDLRIVAGGPAPEPRPGLVAVMNQGAVQLQPSPGRKKMLVKSMLGGLAAKVALGVGVAAASVTAAGAAGVLPAPAQDVVASVVAATTPFQLPTSSSDVTSLVADDLGSTTTSTSTTLTTLAGSKTGDDNEAVNDDNGGTTRAVNHGACVSTAAKDKSNDNGNHGKTVSSIARSDCGKDTTAGSSTTTSSTTSTTSLSAGTARANNSGPGSANSGKGNSGNAGNGNAGNGNSGKGNSGRD